MTPKNKNTTPQETDSKKVKSEAAQARLAENLRANLRRRKDQARERKNKE